MNCFSPVAGILLGETLLGSAPTPLEAGFSPVAGILLGETPVSCAFSCESRPCFSPVAGILLGETKSNPANWQVKTLFQSRCRDSVR